MSCDDEWLAELVDYYRDRGVKKMTIKTDVFELLDARIDLLERKVKRFDDFGNTHNSKELLSHAINIECLSELRTVKSDLEYGVRWSR